MTNLLKKLFTRSKTQIRSSGKYSDDMRLDNFLCNFLKEINCEDADVMYKYHTTNQPHLHGIDLEIYTNKPGRIIGKGGINIYKLKADSMEQLSRLRWIQDVKIHEVGQALPKQPWTEEEIKLAEECELVAFMNLDEI